MRSAKRILTLILLLINSRHPLSRAEIFDLIPDYNHTKSLLAAVRTFERDKRDIKALNICLITHEKGGTYHYSIDLSVINQISITQDQLSVVKMVLEGLDSAPKTQVDSLRRSVLLKLNATTIEDDITAKQKQKAYENLEVVQVYEK
ncbi:hypothetical protein FACS1894125_5010 [Actinomycetota bacterium]|nr:hypothetical protein FACS1894125_5010 [Actinomycetota bacterium]